MKIILSPAKNMKIDLKHNQGTTACFVNESKQILMKLKELNQDELHELFKCSQQIALENFNRYQQFDYCQNTSQAIYAYQGIAYQYLDVLSCDNKQMEYLNKNLLILSSFYGCLKPSDLIGEYRLDFTSNIKINNQNLYKYWNDKVYSQYFKNEDIIINCASNEYSKLIKPFVQENQLFIDIEFVENKNGIYKEMSPYNKMARGAFVRYLAENEVINIEQMKKFNQLGYCFNPELSNDSTLVFSR